MQSQPCAWGEPWGRCGGGPSQPDARGEAERGAWGNISSFPHEAALQRRCTFSVVSQLSAGTNGFAGDLVLASYSAVIFEIFS